MLTHERLLSLLEYDVYSGVFLWRVAIRNGLRPGDVAGTIYKNGRRYIAIDKKRHFAHRLAWFYVHGVWPTDQIDHINRDRDDNRLANLRPATASQNIANRAVSQNNIAGFKGVGCRVGGKEPRYRARIRVNGRLIHLGDFKTPEAANEAYADAATLHFGEFARAV